MTSPIKFFDGGLTKEAKKLAIGIDQSYSGFAFTAMDIDTGDWMTTVSKAPGSHVDRLYWIGSSLENTLKTLIATKKRRLREFKYLSNYPNILYQQKCHFVKNYHFSLSFCIDSCDYEIFDS